MTASAVHPTLRVLPRPPLDPPYDDEVEASLVVEGSLALAFPPPVAALPLRLVPPAAPPPPPGQRPVPDPRPWCRRLAQALVEVLAGVRSAAQLSPHATLEVLAQLERGAGRLTARATGPALRPTLRSMRVCLPCPGVAEVCGVIDVGDRRRAVALRVEARSGRWQCTALEIG